jgi:nuclear pore complex protein Nup133
MDYVVPFSWHKLTIFKEPPYQEQLHLKSVDDMILGFNVLERADGPEILLLTTGMVLAALPNINNIAKMKDDVQ